MNLYNHCRVPLSKITDCPEVEHTYDLRTFKYDHVDYRLWKIAIFQVPYRSWDYTNYEVVAIFDKLVAVLTSTPRWIFLKNQFLYTRVLCLLPPLVALFLHGILMLSVRWSSIVIITVSSTCMRVS